MAVRNASSGQERDRSRPPRRNCRPRLGRTEPVGGHRRECVRHRFA